MRRTAQEDDFLSVLMCGELDRESIRESIVSFLVAGHDNLVNAIIWSLRALSGNPVWLGKMRREAEENGSGAHVVAYDAVSVRQSRASSTEIVADSLQSYHVHLAVLYETLRLWPYVPACSRHAKADDVLPEIPELGLGPVKVFKGDRISWSDFAMARREVVGILTMWAFRD